MSDGPAFVALSLLPVYRWRSVAAALARGDHPSSILRTSCEARRDRDPTLPTAEQLLDRAHAACRRGESAGLQCLLHGNPAYPPALTTLADPPPVLWIRGAVDVFSGPAVAVVGARRASDYALTVSERLAADLAAHGVAVVSGLALGVDASAHRGALSAKGTTIAVLGCGADLVYPAENRDLAAAIVRSGAIVSEFVPGTQPRPEFFPQRNRIISGLSRAVVVVEAGEKSGSLITARCALDQGRDVLAVPGNVLNGRSRGSHALLRDGARLVESVEDVFDELGWARRGNAGSLECRNAHEQGSGAGACAELHATEEPVMAALVPGEPCDLDRISEASGLPVSVLLTRLLELELAGRVRRLPDGQFMRIDRSC